MSNTNINTLEKLFDEDKTVCSNENPASQQHIKPLSANPTKWSNTLKQLVGILPKNWWNVFDHFEELALKGLTHIMPLIPFNTP